MITISVLMTQPLHWFSEHHICNSPGHPKADYYATAYMNRNLKQQNQAIFYA